MCNSHVEDVQWSNTKLVVIYVCFNSSCSTIKLMRDIPFRSADLQETFVWNRRFAQFEPRLLTICLFHFIRSDVYCKIQKTIKIWRLLYSLYYRLLTICSFHFIRSDAEFAYCKIQKAIQIWKLLCSLYWMTFYFLYFIPTF